MAPIYSKLGLRSLEVVVSILEASEINQLCLI